MVFFNSRRNISDCSWNILEDEEMSFEELEMFRSLGFEDDKMLKAAKQIEEEREFLEYCDLAANSHKNIG